MAASLKNYEKKYKALEDVVRQLNDDDLTISEMLTQYKKGLTLVKECADMLNSVETEIQQIIEEVRISE
ncbi:exodeoxyribonuclease VII small subunit [Veillonella caviae]|uniref:exodeoxyribonuclease VII small subunit n=1 Tax=Veillonella caviae TaxID=248316 RepID=UPI000F8E9094|nr:exodeoxyribonuclease VII small subunit [Veillonella caviae]MCF0158320.1 exodeoxyribonuclease VII small subunit [Veillonella sp.]MCI5708145.1 exodeoxyribonuclease VII small subunit [Veillonella caviae]MCI6407552.1 exodeoxyribonuclease VII small subunit [Veillonella caviae]MCI7693085.1 exodeoxyribonuclease VII small subunit [Veillonella caviae]MDD7291602.1 exodeoxyribonuclease VII small subunit [Veillonella caviae]